MDVTNGLFEFFGGVLLILNCVRIHRDKKVMGVSILPVAFFTIWGLWNLAYYPHLGQWWSFSGGIFVVSVNAVWLGQVWYWGRNTKHPKSIIDKISEST